MLIKRVSILSMFAVIFLNPMLSAAKSHLPPDFVYIKQVIPNIVIDLRYYGNYNFIGHRIAGYDKPTPVLTRQAASALKQVQQELNNHGLGLKIYDSYRPQKAVNEFVQWAKNLQDTKMKRYFYPHEAKKNLFRDGYIAAKSSHTRGSTVDLTIICLRNCHGHKYADLDMGSTFDMFSKVSWPSYQKLSPAARAHRLLLRLVMEKYGFAPIKTEWWHFTLRNEPFPHTYFDFDIK